MAVELLRWIGYNCDGHGVRAGTTKTPAQVIAGQRLAIGDVIRTKRANGSSH
jgi:hypothetical protein